MSSVTANPLAFSTLGCPGASLDEVVARARLGGCTGIELRCRPGELIEPHTTQAEAARLRDALADNGLQVVCVASYVQLGLPGDDVLTDLRRHIDLAGVLGAPFVRVFCGDGPAVVQRAASRLREAGRVACESGVEVLLETHDSLLTGRAVADVLEAADAPCVGAIWDVVNPWRAGEPVRDTASALRPWLRHVQLKDVASPDDLRPVVPGEGIVPLPEVRRELDAIGYSAWLSLEWEAAWYPDAPPLDDALTAFRAMMLEPVS